MSIRKKIIISLLLLTMKAMCFAYPVRIHTWNLCTDYISEEGFASESHAKWQFANRFPHIKDAIQQTVEKDKKQGATGIFFFQELRCYTTDQGIRVDSVTLVKELIDSIPLECIQTPYNDSDTKAYSFLLAYDPTVFEHEADRATRLFLTETPDTATEHSELYSMRDSQKEVQINKQKQHYLNVKGERSLQVTYLKRRNDNKHFICLNVHLAPNKKHRMLCMPVIKTQVEKLQSENPEATIILAGDFNSFPDDGQDKEHMAILAEEDGFYNLTWQRQPFSGKEPRDNTSTFLAYPFDFIKPSLPPRSMEETLGGISIDKKRTFIHKHLVEAKNVDNEEYTVCGGHLDHIIVYNQAGSISSQPAIITPFFIAENFESGDDEDTAKESLDCLRDEGSDVLKNASSVKSVGHFWLRQFTKRVIQGYFRTPESSKTVCFSRSHFYFGV